MESYLDRVDRIFKEADRVELRKHNADHNELTHGNWARGFKSRITGAKRKSRKELQVRLKRAYGFTPGVNQRVYNAFTLGELDTLVDIFFGEKVGTDAAVPRENLDGWIIDVRNKKRMTLAGIPDVEAVVLSMKNARKTKLLAERKRARQTIFGNDRSKRRRFMLSKSTREDLRAW